MTQAAREALTLLDALPPGPLSPRRSGRFGELVATLEPLRFHPAIGMGCPRCGAGLGFCAVEPSTAHVVSANRRLHKSKRQGGIYDLDRLSTYQGRSEAWVEDAQAGKGKVRPTGDAPGQSTGLPGRRTYACRRCGAACTVRDRSLLSLYLGAVVDGDREVSLAKAKPRKQENVVRVGSRGRALAWSTRTTRK
jgi:hypothetical protein